MAFKGLAHGFYKGCNSFLGVSCGEAYLLPLRGFGFGV